MPESHFYITQRGTAYAQCTVTMWRHTISLINPLAYNVNYSEPHIRMEATRCCTKRGQSCLTEHITYILTCGVSDSNSDCACLHPYMFLHILAAQGINKMYVICS